MENKNENKIILDLCGGTGSWSKPYKDAGYKVFLITLPKYDVLPNYWAINDGHIFFYPESFWPDHSGIYEAIPIKDIYGILAAPPCTEFSRAKTTVPRDFEKGMETVRAVLEIIWQCQIHNRIQFWALENPMGMLRRFLGRPDYTFHPWFFGDLHTKATDLWGWFNKPKRTVFDEPVLFTRDKYPSGNPKFFGSPNCPEEYRHLKLKRSDIRAITPPGFAKAFFKANQ